MKGGDALGICELDSDKLKICCVVGTWKEKQWTGKPCPAEFRRSQVLQGIPRRGEDTRPDHVRDDDQRQCPETEGFLHQVAPINLCIPQRCNAVASTRSQSRPENLRIRAVWSLAPV